MHFQKVPLTERYDIVNVLKHVEKKTFSDKLKYRILKTHFKPDEDFTFPKTYLYECNWLCSLNFLSNLFVGITSSDSAFCIHCALFLFQEKIKDLNTFLNVGCNDWRNIIVRQSIHIKWKYHKDAIKNPHYLINYRFEKPEGTIDYHSDTVYRDRCSKHSNILEVVIRAIHFHERKGFALRGHRETLKESDVN